MNDISLRPYAPASMPTVTVMRPELMERLNKMMGKRLIFISAPAGFGKTVSTLMWLEKLDAGNAWLNLDAYDNKPTAFYGRLCGALQSLQPQNEELNHIISRLPYGAEPAELAVRAIDALTEGERKAVLVLDDLHSIDNANILNMLPLLFKRLPANFILAILSRSAVPECFADLLLKGGISQVSADDLRLTSAEIGSFFEGCGQKLSEPELKEAHAFTGGWAIGVNALILSGNRQVGGTLAQEYLTSFIKTQVWNRWSKRIQDFLVKSSVVEELTPDFCVALTDDPSSEEILRTLVRNNAFLSVWDKGIYRFHQMFRNFLLTMLDELGAKAKNKQYQKAGSWLYEHKDYHKAIRCYMECGDDDGIVASLSCMYDYNSPYAAIGDTLQTIYASLNDNLVNKHPFLMEVQAWAAFADGRADEMQAVLDRYYKRLPQVVVQNPASLQTMYLLRCMDPRTKMIEFTKKLNILPPKGFLGKGTGTPSITHNMPLFHRSSRDFSEYVHHMEDSCRALRGTIGRIIGAEYDVLENCILAGLLHEQGEREQAVDYAMTAVAKMRDDFAPEIKFCALMIMSHVLLTAGRGQDAEYYLQEAWDMIASAQAYYLTPNYDAFVCRTHIAGGSRQAAENYLEGRRLSACEHPAFYKLYTHFAEVRAYLAVASYNEALILLKKLLALCLAYNRPLDIIETLILTAITYEKCGGHDNALASLERAAGLAQPYGYTQLFVDDSFELAAMLRELAVRDEQGFIQKLCVLSAG